MEASNPGDQIPPWLMNKPPFQAQPQRSRYIGMQICYNPMTSSLAVPNILRASQPLPTSHCQIKQTHPLGECAPRRPRCKNRRETNPGPLSQSSLSRGRPGSPGLGEKLFMGSTSNKTWEPILGG